ncbi:MAG TPA: hypothetical protein DDZ51_05950 [Planctomycetaceae bacterium]|nr:hypothetical protein [Planctomycetaceae bacterium]
MLVDGDRLRSAATRQGAKNEVQMLLQCCLDAGQLGLASLVDVVVTKWDKVSKAELDDTEAFVDALTGSMDRKFRARVGRLRYFKIAARPDNEDYGLGFGIEKMFPSWVLERSASVVAPIRENEGVIGCCEYDRFRVTDGAPT